MNYTLLSQSGGEPLSVVEAKAHSVIEHDQDDQLIADNIVQAREQVEHDTGVCIIKTQYRLTLDQWPEQITLRFPPFRSVESVKYIDPDGQEQALAPASYRVVERYGLANIFPAPGTSWPAVELAPGAITIEFTAGYGAPDMPSAPSGLMRAVRLLCHHYYQYRGSIVTGTIVSKLPQSYNAAIAPHRVY